MSLTWLVQIGFDFVTLAVVGFWFFDRRAEKAARAAQEARLNEAMGKAHDYVQQLEEEALQYRKAAESHLRVLARICDEAARFSNRYQFSEINPSPSLEETELRAILKAPAAQEAKIPTLEQVERTRRRLDTEVNFDLRTLLRDQLS